MKKIIASFFIIFAINSLFANEILKKENHGTYIPYKMYEIVEKTKSYYKGISATNETGFYTVLCVTEKGILSNVKFHDAFMLQDNEINFAVETIEDTKFLIDEVTGIDYIKISDSTDYYAVYEEFLKEMVLEEIALKNSNLRLEDSKIFFKDEEFIIDKDQWHYSENLQIILYSKATRNYIGFLNNKAYSLMDGDELQKVLDSSLELFDDKIILSLDLTVSELIELFGEPNKMEVIEFSGNRDFDTITYEYDELFFSKYKIYEKPHTISITSKDYCFNVDNKIITCGFSKDEMDSLFRKGNLDGKDAMGNKFFYYGLTDLREIRVLYNQRNEAIQIIYGYTAP